ncbi:MAG: restriction endonuclease subunit S [Ferruginibacter sp.]|nr:restriction endonuclease subunit S [Ferruginibacter sp.]
MIGEKQKLKEVCVRITKGTTPSTYGFPFVESGINFVKAESILEGGGILPNTFAYIDDATHEYLKRSILYNKDILISIAGAKLGKCGFLTEEYLPANTNQAVGIVRVDSSYADPKFVYYNFVSNHTYQLINSLNSQAAQPNLNLGQLGELEFHFPKLPTQRKIASILSAYDDLIENNLKRIKLLEEKAQLHFIQNKPIEKIALHDVADYLGRGVTPKYEDGSGFYAINQKANKGSLLEYSQFKSLDSKLEVPEDKYAKWGDLLINSLGEGTLGRVHFYTDKSDLFAVDQHMSIFRTQKQHYTFFLYQFFSSTYGQGLLDSLKKGGTNMTMLNISDLRQLVVSFPIEKELIDLWNICKPLFQLKQTLINQNIKLREARDILLPRLMSGEIEV